MKWISVVILLVALSMVNASPFHIYKRDILHKRAIPIEPCKEPSTIKLAGSVDPDPVPGTPAKSTLTFTTTEEVAKLFLTTTVTDGAAAKEVTTADLCTAGLKCPVAKGQEVTTTTTTDIPKEIKAPFEIEFNFNDGAKTVACGVAKVAKAAEGAPGAEPKDPKEPEDPAGEPKDPEEPEEPAGEPKDPKEPEDPAGEPKDPKEPEDPAGEPKDPKEPEDPAGEPKRK